MNKCQAIGRNMLMTQGSGILPIEYQKVAWIKSTGTQYIDTGLIASKNHKYELGFAFDLNRNIETLGGSISSGKDKDLIFIRIYNNNFYISYGNSIPININYDYNYHEIIINDSNKNCYFDDIYFCNLTNAKYILTNNTIWLFSANYDEKLKEYTGNGKIYYFRIYENNNLIRNFVPSYRKTDNIIGMYDLCGSICSKTNSPFYINLGDGYFEKGEDVN